MATRRSDKWHLDFDDYQCAYMVGLLEYAMKMHDDLAKGSKELGEFSKFSHRNSLATATQLHSYITTVIG